MTGISIRRESDELEILKYLLNPDHPTVTAEESLPLTRYKNSESGKTNVRSLLKDMEMCGHLKSLRDSAYVGTTQYKTTQYTITKRGREWAEEKQLTEKNQSEIEAMCWGRQLV